MHKSYMTVMRGLSAVFLDELTFTVIGTVDRDPKSSKSPIPATMMTTTTFNRPQPLALRYNTTFTGLD